jgi:hypothetical protein
LSEELRRDACDVSFFSGIAVQIGADSLLLAFEFYDRQVDYQSPTPYLRYVDTYSLHLGVNVFDTRCIISFLVAVISYYTPLSPATIELTSRNALVAQFSSMTINKNPFNSKPSFWSADVSLGRG